VYCILALLFALGPLNVFGWDYAVSFFCPADTFLSETTSVGFLWLMGSSFLAMFGLCGQISWFIPTPKRPRPADEVIHREHHVVHIGLPGGFISKLLFRAVTCETEEQIRRNGKRASLPVAEVQTDCHIRPFNQGFLQELPLAYELDRPTVLHHDGLDFLLCGGCHFLCSCIHQITPLSRWVPFV